MSTYLSKFEFEPDVKEIQYLEGEPLKLNEKFSFFHNKNFFRKNLNRLQNLMKDYLRNSLTAAGIRDSYLKEEYSEKYLIVLFTDIETIKNANQILAPKENIDIKPSCYYMESAGEYFLLLAREKEGLKLGLETMELILKQVLDHYFNQKNFDEYIQIVPFKLHSCKALKEG